MAPQAAEALGVKTMIIGIANVGGLITYNWIPSIMAALEHLPLVRTRRSPAFPRSRPRLAAPYVHLSKCANHPMISRRPQGAKRSGRRSLTVGTDCAVGKKYTALALKKVLRGRGVNADFRATGQTAISFAPWLGD